MTKVVEKVNSTTLNSISSINNLNFKRNYNRSHFYADISYRNNFNNHKEFLARAGFIYYFK